jgi:16S rRNA (guanine527-N7)-methyltransferase
LNDDSAPKFATLAAALQHFEIELPDDQIESLDRYCQLLWEWNQKMNLTRHDNYEKFVARDIKDSVELASILEPDEEVLDVGTGGGVPGIPLAILRPDIQVSLCDSIAKKAKAVDDIVNRLQLPIPVYHDHAQTILEDLRFTTLAVRAVGPMAKLLKWFEPHWPSIGRLLLFKGPQWISERGEARHLGLLANLDLRRRHVYTIPGMDVESVILEISPQRSEPAS